MTDPHPIPRGAPAWIELFASDTDRSTAFYRELFGWSAESAGEEYGGYINLSTSDGHVVAGCMRNDGTTGAPDGWSVYLSTDDVELTAKDTTEHGGRVVMPPMDIMDLGKMAVVADPDGAVIGAWQPGTHPGFDVIGEPGTPAWFELHTRDYQAAVAYYRDVFGWDVHVVSDEPEFRYTTHGEGDNQRAGIMDAAAFVPDGVPAHWSIYFGVTDADVAVTKVTELGGSVVLPPEDTPYGRLAELADPSGVTFKIVAG